MGTRGGIDREADARCESDETKFWMDCEEDELLQLVEACVPESVQQKAREMASYHFDKLFQSAVYVKERSRPTTQANTTRSERC